MIYYNLKATFIRREEGQITKHIHDNYSNNYRLNFHLFQMCNTTCYVFINIFLMMFVRLQIIDLLGDSVGDFDCRVRFTSSISFWIWIMSICNIVISFKKTTEKRRNSRKYELKLKFELLCEHTLLWFWISNFFSNSLNFGLTSSDVFWMT